MSHSNQTNNYTDFFYYSFRNILLVSIPLLVISALAMSSSTLLVKADGRSSDRVAVTIPTSCTIVIDQTHTTDHEVTLNSGQYKQGIGNTRMGAYCNDLNGYYIYAIGYGANTEGNNKLVSSLGNTYDIATGTALSGDTSNWAMKISTASSGTTLPYVVDEYRNYTMVPSNYDVVAYRESGTASSSTSLDVSGSYIDTTYQAYVTSVQPADTYVGQVKYTLIHPFDATKIVSVDTAFRIAQKDKYILKTDGTWIIETDPSASSIPESSIAGRYYAMQDMSRGVCNLVTMRGEKTQTQLIDIRDGKLYWTARLADDNCWMTQNLDLDIISDTNAQNYVALTSENTDLSTNESIYTNSNTIYALKGANDTYGYTYENGIATWIPERSTLPYGQLNSNSWQNAYYTPHSYDGGETYPDSNVSQAIAGNHGLSGNYYNWTAAVASNDSTNATENPVNSICPKGWRLPNATNQEFGNLLVQYGIIETNISRAYLDGGFDKMVTTPLYFVRSGLIRNDGSLDSSGNSGYYQSNTYVNWADAFYLNFGSNSINPQNSSGYSRGPGRSVRCLAK